MEAETGKEADCGVDLRTETPFMHVLCSHGLRAALAEGSEPIVLSKKLLPIIMSLSCCPDVCNSRTACALGR